MSAMEEKLQRPETQTSTRARCWYFKDLWWKRPRLQTYRNDKEPLAPGDILHVRSMDSEFVWKVLMYDRKRRDYLMELVGEQLAIPKA